MSDYDVRFREIKDNFDRVTENIENARAHSPYGGKICLLAATKHVPTHEILYAVHELGLEKVGENRVDELLSKYDDLAGQVPIHFIGTLQTNKIKQLVGRVDMIESVASVRAAREIAKKSLSLGVTTDILCEINSGREENKSGVFPEDARAVMEEMAEIEGVKLKGCMTMAPVCGEKEEYRKFFAKTYEIFIDFFDKNKHNILNPVLSMGMSDSYEIAASEGATEVRVGSAIFGKRIY